MKFRLNIINKSRYDFENDNGQRVVGAKISYLDTTKKVTNTREGLDVLTIDLADISLYDRITAPAVYEVEFGIVPAGRNKVKTVITDVEYVEQLVVGAN